MAIRIKRARVCNNNDKGNFVEKKGKEGTVLTKKEIRKYATWLVCIFFGVIAVSALIATIWPAQTAAQTETGSTPKTIYEKVYYLKDYNGKIAVYEEGSETPFKVTEAEVSALPVLDQKQLKDEGIKAQGKKELDRLLQDYCS